MPITISPSTLNDAVRGVSYSQTFSASGGSGTYTWANPAGGTGLPSGLSLSSGGVLSGTSNDTAGSYTFNVRATDSLSSTTTVLYTLELLNQIDISPTTLDDMVKGYAYSETFSATGGVPPYTWSNPGGGRPPGITLSSGGVLSGTPTSTGNYTFNVRATDSTGRSNTESRSVTVQNSIDIDPDIMPNATVGTAYSQTITVTGGVSPYTYAITSGSLPAGLNLVGNTITGTPTTAGTSVFRLRVRDNKLNTYFWNFIIIVAAGAPPPSGPPTYAISVNTTTINEGQSAIYSISLTNFGDGFLYWKNLGTTQATDFSDGLNEGSVLISNNTGTLTRKLANDFKTEIVETIDIRLLSGSLTGPTVATTSTVNVIDTSNTPREIVSGILILDDDYNIIQSRVEEILGLGLDGYGLAAVRATQVTKRSRITLNQWNNLLLDINRITTQVSGTSTDYPLLTTNTTVITTSNSINYFNHVNSIYFNDTLRYSCYPGGTYPSQFYSDNNSEISFSAGISTSTTTIWYGSMSHIVRYVFASPLIARHFFNSGGTLVWEPYFEPGPAESASDASWAAFISAYKGGVYGGQWTYKREQWVTTATTYTRTYSSGTKQIVLTVEKNVEIDPSISQYPDRFKFTCVFVDTALPAFLVTPSGYTLEPGP